MNRFAVFADAQEEVGVAAPQKQAAPSKETKKVVVRKPKTAEPNQRAQQPADGEEYQAVTDNRGPQRGGDRRGGRGGDRPRGGDGEYRGGRGRGGDGEYRGGRGGDRPRGEGRGRGRGEGRGRGRGGQDGGRPRTGVAGTENEDINAAVPDEHRTQRREGGHHFHSGGYGPRDTEHHFTGKAREEAHPFDRHSGTGAGKKDFKKGGHGKGNWGDEKKPIVEVPEGEKTGEETKEQPRRERREKKPEPEPVVEEEEEVGFTLQDYLN